MSLSFVSQATVLVTTSVNSDGSIDLSNISDSNTVQIPIIKDSLSLTYQEDYQYIPINNSISAPIYLEAYSNTVLSVQELRFSTYISSNKNTSVPVDFYLWESLSRQPFNTDTGVSKIGLFDGTKLPRFVGVIIIFENTCFIYSNVLVSQAAINLDMTGIPSITWGLRASNTSQVVSPTITNGVLSGSIAGTFKPYYVEDYSLTASKFLKLTIGYGIESYIIASRNCTINIDNTYEYMNSGSSITTYNTAPLFAGYIKSSCSGQFSFYMRGTVNTFFEQVIFANKNSQIKNPYSILIELPLPSGDPMCTIEFKSTMIEPALNSSQVLEGSCQFKAITSSVAETSAIKFYN